MIKNSEQREKAMKSIEVLVNAVEEYDRGQQNASVLNGFGDINNTMAQQINEARLNYELDLQRRFDHEVKGSLEPQHPLDDSGPRGVIFFRSLEW